VFLKLSADKLLVFQLIAGPKKEVKYNEIRDRSDTLKIGTKQRLQLSYEFSNKI